MASSKNREKKHLQFTNNGNGVFENCIFIVRCVGEYCLLSGRLFWISLSICVHFYIFSSAHQLCQRPPHHWRRRRSGGHRCHWFSWISRCGVHGDCAFQFKLASHRYYVKVFCLFFSFFSLAKCKSVCHTASPRLDDGPKQTGRKKKTAQCEIWLRFVYL